MEPLMDDQEKWKRDEEERKRLLEEARAQMRKLQAFANPPTYSRGIIERYRAQDFRRDVIDRVPVDLDNDELSLSCGHKAQMMFHMMNAMDPVNGLKFSCTQCAKEWLAKAVEEEKRDTK